MASDRALSGLLGAAVLAVLLLTSGGHFYSADGSKEYEVTRAIVTRQALDVPEGLGVRGTDGRFYPPHGLGQSIAWVPFYLGGTALEKAGFGSQAHGLVASWLNALAIAGTVALLALLALRLGTRRPAAAAVALAYGFTTMAWVYSKNTFDVALTGFLIIATVAGLERAERTGESRALILAGAALGWAGVTRVSTLVLWPVAGLFVLMMGRSGVAARAVRFGLPLAASLGVIFAYNAARFGSVTDDGHAGDPATALDGAFLEGLGGLLFSPGRGLVFYAPLVLVAAFGWRTFQRTRPNLTLLAGASVAAMVFVHAKVNGWHGGFSWGPRFLLPVLPLAVLPAAFVFDRWGNLPRARKALVAGTLAAGLLVTLPGVLADYQVQVLLRNEAGHSVDDVWSFDNAAYVFHARTLDDIVAGDAPFPGAKTESDRPDDNTWDFWWWYAIIQRRAVPLVIAALITLFGAAAFLGRAAARAVRAPPPAPEQLPARASV